MKAFIGVKIVSAAKIDKVMSRDDGRGKLTFVGGKVMVVSKDYMDKHQPKRGGYFVRYPDGYTSWSPGKTFEDAYREVLDTEAEIIVDNFIAEHDPENGS